MKFNTEFTKFTIGDHLQEIDDKYHGIVSNDHLSFDKNGNEDGKMWYLLENDELGLVNHWVPENKLELHKQPLREQKLKELGI